MVSSFTRAARTDAGSDASQPSHVELLAGTRCSAEGRQQAARGDGGAAVEVADLTALTASVAGAALSRAASSTVPEAREVESPVEPEALLAPASASASALSSAELGLDPVADKHLRTLVEQVLRRQNLRPEVWADTVLSLVIRACTTLRPDVRHGTS